MTSFVALQILFRLINDFVFINQRFLTQEELAIKIFILVYLVFDTVC